MKHRFNLVVIAAFFLLQGGQAFAALEKKLFRFNNTSSCMRNLVPHIESIDSTSVDSSRKYTYLDLGADYNSNNNLGGQFNNIEVQPAWSASASLTSKSGFDASLNYSFIQNSDTSYTKATSNANLEFGYAFDFLQYFNLHLSVNHTFQPKNTSSLKKGYDNSLAADLSYDFKWFYGSLTSSYMLGNKTATKAAKLNSLSFALANNLSLEIENFLAEDNSLTFHPGFAASISDQRLYNDYLLTALTDNPKQLIAKLIKKRPKLTVAEAISILKARTVKGQKFQATSFGFNMPIAWALGDYTLTITPSAYKPLNQPSFIDSSWKFIFQLGVIYSFSW
jgi:hypothetical protein